MSHAGIMCTVERLGALNGDVAVVPEVYGLVKNLTVASAAASAPNDISNWSACAPSIVK